MSTSAKVGAEDVTTSNVADLLEFLVGQNRPLLERYDPDDAIRLFDEIPVGSLYNYISEELTDLWSALSKDFGENGFDAFQRITMLTLMNNFEKRSSGRRYSESIIERFQISFRRITQSISDQKFGKYRNCNDILLKDLAICLQRVFPAGGARVVEPKSGFPRSLMLQGGLTQGFKVLSLLIKSWGHTPFYSHHTHLSELEEFNPVDFIRCNIRLADMLELHREIKGVHCGSWLYDPALETVSPHLSYMRKLQLDNGALIFYAGVSIQGGALAKSKTRRALYEEGKYIPKSYHIIWPRQRLIAWADKAVQDIGVKQAGHSAQGG